jgi:D-arabinose 1-dehydrogenase-like Zn-dependent alcohol dehydrogenase
MSAEDAESDGGSEKEGEMQAVRLEDGAVVVVRVPIPEPKPGEARLRILQGGVCNTDVELTRG